MIPVVIIAFNQLTYIRNMVQQCLPLTDKIYIIDNGSLYKPLVDWYKNDVPQIKAVELIRHPYNEGHMVWQKYLDRFPEEYVLTDPDLLFNPEMPVDAINILSDIGKKFNYNTVGLALDITEHEDFIAAKFHDQYIHDFERVYWVSKVQSEPEEIYAAGIDTTFALHSKSRPDGSLRVAGRFTCKHIPWYRRDKSPLPVPDDEYEFFHRTTRSTNWRV